MFRTQKSRIWENMCSTGNFFQKKCSTRNIFQKWISGVGLMHFGQIERILSPKNAFSKSCCMTGVEISTEIDIFGHFHPPNAFMMCDMASGIVRICLWEVFPQHILSPRVDLGSVLLQTSEGEIRIFLAPPETFFKKKCSTGNFFRKWISGVDLMHFGPIERILSPNYEFSRGGGLKLSSPVFC